MYANRMMDSDFPRDGDKEVAGIICPKNCSCGAELRFAEELQTRSGKFSNVFYCPNPQAHGGELQFQKA